MKFRFKNINENTVNEINNQQNNQQNNNSAFDIYEADAKYQYILQRKKEALPVNIILPEKFDLPVKLPIPPEDISNIMYAYQNNKARKTKNIGGVMQDPIQTYNHTEACCKEAFGNFFGQAINIEDDEKQRKVNTSYIQKNALESYYNNYNEFPALNESASGAGIAIGTGIGSLLGSVLSFTGGVTLGLASTVGVQVAALGASAYLLGYYGEELFGNVEGGGISNDKVAAHLNAKTQNMLKIQPSEPQKYTDIVSAIETYVKDIIEASGDIAGLINSEGSTKIDEISKFAIGFMKTQTKRANEYIETHSKEIEEQKRLAQEKRENDLTKQKNRADSVKTFVIQSQDAWATQAKGEEGFKDYNLLKKIQSVYEQNPTNSNAIDLKNALEETGWKGLKSKFIELFPKYESINIQNFNKLNEDNIKNNEHDTSQKLLIDAETVYDGLLQEFIAKYKEVFPQNIDAKKITKYEETKQQMQDLIDAADKSINSKIEQITKVSTGETAATGGLGQAAKVFLMGHPLESNNLKEVWSRHLVDLKQRMTNRLSQMTNTNDKTRTLGWTIYICRNVIPEILARMLTYRYIYAILSNNGFFNYNTETMKADEQAFQQDKSMYINLPKSKLIWILNNICADYTANGQQIFVQNETNGGWKLSSNNMPYAFFLVQKLYPSAKGNKTTISALAEFLANIKSFVKEEDQTNQFLGVIMSILSQSSHNSDLLNSSDKDKFNELVLLFKMPDDIKNIKNEILTTYNLLKDQANKISDDRDKLVNIAKTLTLISKHPMKIYETYIKNRGVIDELINKLENTKNTDKNLTKDIKSKMMEFFGNIINENDLDDNYNNVTSETIKKLLPENQSNDYYSSILYIYPLVNNMIWDDNKKIMKQKSVDAIKQVCKVVKDLLPLEFSGILAYAMDIDKKDKEEENKLNISISEIRGICDVYNKTLQTIESIKPIKEKVGTLNPSILEFEKELTTSKDIMFKQFTSQYASINKETNAQYEFENIFNDEKSFKEFIKAIKLFEETDDQVINGIKGALKDYQIKALNNDANATIKTFGQIDDDNIQNTMFNNLAASIQSVKNNKSYQKLSEYMSKIDSMYDKLMKSEIKNA